MDTVILESDPLAQPEAVRSEAVHTAVHQAAPDQDEAAPPGFNPYPLAGVALIVASAALACGGLLYVLERAGIHLPH